MARTKGSPIAGLEAAERGMAADGAGETEGFVEWDFEIVDADEVIDGGGERGGAAGARRPNLRADIFDEPNMGRCGAHALRDAHCEAPGIDQHYDIGFGRDDGGDRLRDGALHAAIGEQAIDKAQHGEARNVDGGLDALFRHRGAADAGDLKRGVAVFQGADEIGAERIA